LPDDDFKIECQRLNRKLQRVLSKVKGRGTKNFSLLLLPLPLSFSLLLMLRSQQRNTYCLWNLVLEKSSIQVHVKKRAIFQPDYSVQQFIPFEFLDFFKIPFLTLRVRKLTILPCLSSAAERPLAFRASTTFSIVFPLGCLKNPS
jgi:hypothetical protein